MPSCTIMLLSTLQYFFDTFLLKCSVQKCQNKQSCSTTHAHPWKGTIELHNEKAFRHFNIKILHPWRRSPFSLLHIHHVRLLNFVISMRLTILSEHVMLQGKDPLLPPVCSSSQLCIILFGLKLQRKRNKKWLCSRNPSLIYDTHVAMFSIFLSGME